ncbi:MAG: ArnT family glycosyltransferase [Candidatus Scalinduaceae bacterium]
MKLLSDKYFWILLFVSLFARIYLGIFTYVIQNDSVAFMQNAEYFADGDFLSGLRHPYHPLYSLIMAGLYKIVPNMELSGTITSVFFGMFAVVAFYLIGKGIFDQKIAFISSIIMAFHPYAVRFSANIISESTYFFFFISALGLGFFAITNKKLLLFALTGICTAFAYLTRPEGIGIIFIVICWYLFRDFFKIKIAWKEKLVSILVLVVSFLVFSLPYLVYIEKETGSWQLTKKKNLSQILGIEKELSSQSNEKSGVRKISKKGSSDIHIIKQTVVGKSNKLSKRSNEKLAGENVVNNKEVLDVNNKKQTVIGKIDFKIHLKSIFYIMNKYLSTLHPLLFMFLIIGVINWARIRETQLFGFYITTIILFYLIVLYRLNITFIATYDDIYQYPSRRHLMPIIIPALFCVGIGVYTAGTWLHKRFPLNRLRSGFGELLRSVWVIQLIVLLVVIGVLLPKTFKPQGLDKLRIKKVGQWIKGNSDKPSPAIISLSPRNAYYAGGKHIQMTNIDSVLSLARARKADYIVITQKEYQVIKEELRKYVKNNQLLLVYKYVEKTSLNGKNTLLYKVLY